MSLTLSSAHVHTTFCDGKTPAPDMAKRAAEPGFVSLGFSSHAPQDFDPGYCIPPEREEAYKAHIRALGRQYEPGSGVQSDSEEVSDWDFDMHSEKFIGRVTRDK